MQRIPQKLITLSMGIILSQSLLVACSPVNVAKDAVNPDSKAAEALLKSTGLSVGSVDEALLKAANAIQEGKMDLAQLYYIKGFELQPTNIELLQKMAELYVHLEKYELAEVSFKLILKQQPNNIKVQEEYGLLLLKERKYQEAKKIPGKSWLTFRGSKGRWKSGHYRLTPLQIVTVREKSTVQPKHPRF